MISRFAGLREDLVQAGGGNSSVKIDGRFMYVKSSGYRLSDLKEGVGYSKVDYALIADYFSQPRDISSSDEQELLTKCHIEGARPSIETFLHAITGAYTLHTHPTIVNILACREHGMSQLAELFPEALCVEYKTPGINLAASYFKAIVKNGIRNVIFLQNHGLFVNGDDAHGIKTMTETVISKIEQYLGVDCIPYHNLTRIQECFDQCGIHSYLHYCNDANIRALAAKGMWRYDFCPDCLVYCGEAPLVLREHANMAEDIQKHLCSFGIPVVVWYMGSCYICAENQIKAREIESVLRFSAMVSAYEWSGKLHYLSKSETDFLVNWDSEKYRKTLGG
jgi:rhamnose utilization protein RhaD (predicted bifunctional aldolase and dehydrogenase)